MFVIIFSDSINNIKGSKISVYVTNGRQRSNNQHCNSEHLLMQDLRLYVVKSETIVCF